MLLKISGSFQHSNSNPCTNFSASSRSACYCLLSASMYPAYLPQDITSIRKLLIPVNGYQRILLVGYNSLILILCIFKSAFVNVYRCLTLKGAFVNVYRCLTLKGKLYTHMTLVWVTGLLHKVHTPMSWQGSGVYI